MRRFISVLTALFASCALTPLPAQTVLIPGPDTITMAKGDRRAIACDAFDTRGHYVSRATCRLSVESGLEARGDTLIAGAPDSLYLVRATWLRSDGGRPSDSVWVRVVATPSLPPVVVPPPDTVTPPPVVVPPPDTTTAPPPPPPPVVSPPPPSFPTLPEVRSRTFAGSLTSQQLRGSGWDDVELQTGASMAFVADPDRGTVMEVTYPAGMRSGVAPIRNIQTLTFGPYTEVIIDTWIKVGADFPGNWTGENKQWWFGINGQGNNVFLTFRGSGTGRLFPGIKAQGIHDERQETSPTGVVSCPSVTIPRDQWVRYTLYVKMNTFTNGNDGRADGVLALAVNGTVCDAVSDFDFTLDSQPGNPARVRQVQYSPTWGGGGAAVPQTGKLRVSTTAIYAR